MWHCMNKDEIKMFHLYQLYYILQRKPMFRRTNKRYQTFDAIIKNIWYRMSFLINHTMECCTLQIRFIKLHVMSDHLQRSHYLFKWTLLQLPVLHLQAIKYLEHKKYVQLILWKPTYSIHTFLNNISNTSYITQNSFVVCNQDPLHSQNYW